MDIKRWTALALLTVMLGGCVVVPWGSGHYRDGYGRGHGYYGGDGYYRDHGYHPGYGRRGYDDRRR